MNLYDRIAETETTTTHPRRTATKEEKRLLRAIDLVRAGLRRGFRDDVDVSAGHWAALLELKAALQRITDKPMAGLRNPKIQAHIERVMASLDRLVESFAGDQVSPLGVSKQARKQVGNFPLPLGRKKAKGEQIHPDQFEEQSPTRVPGRAGRRRPLVTIGERVDVAGVYVLNTKTGKKLLLKRKDGRWDITKGGVDPGEKPRQAAKRETGEESGIAPKVSAAYVDVVNAKNQKKLRIYLGTTKKTKTKLMPSEHTRAKWVDDDEAIEKLQKTPHLAKAIEKLRSMG